MPWWVVRLKFIWLSYRRDWRCGTYHGGGLKDAIERVGQEQEMGNAQSLLSMQSNVLDMLRRLCILFSNVNKCYKCEVHEEPRWALITIFPHWHPLSASKILTFGWGWCLKVPNIWNVIYHCSRYMRDESPARTTGGRFSSETGTSWWPCQYLWGAMLDVP